MLIWQKNWNRNIRQNDILTVLADGQPVASGYRNKILKKEKTENAALKY